MLGTALLAVVAGSVGGGTAGLVTGRQRPAADADLPRSAGGPVTGDLSDVAGRVLPKVVSVRVRRDGRTATGSGSVVDRRGWARAVGSRRCRPILRSIRATRAAPVVERIIRS